MSKQPESAITIGLTFLLLAVLVIAMLHACRSALLDPPPTGGLSKKQIAAITAYSCSGCHQRA